MNKKAIFGLGNYGIQYKRTRHNIGFEILDNILLFMDEKNKNLSFENQKHWEILSKKMGENEIFFVKAKDFINNSGVLIKKFMKKFNLDIKDIIVIQDDISMNFGKIRIKRNSSSGGHNGVKSMIKELGSEKFCRIKVGVGNSEQRNLKEWVLSKFNKEEIKEIEKISRNIEEILTELIKEKN